VLWLQEDVLLRRVHAPKAKKRKSCSGEATEVVAKAEAELLAQQLGVTVSDVVEMVADDRGLDPETGESIDDRLADEKEEEDQGTLLKAGTIDSYVAAVAEMHALQLTIGLNAPPTIRGPALHAVLEERRRAQNDNDRAAFVDRGSGISIGYSDEEFLKLQNVLLQGLTGVGAIGQVKF